MLSGKVSGQTQGGPHIFVSVSHSALSPPLPLSHTLSCPLSLPPLKCLGLYVSVSVTHCLSVSVSVTSWACTCSSKLGTKSAVN